MRLPFFLAVLAAGCSREVARYQSQTVAFLGDASGIYTIDSGLALPTGERLYNSTIEAAGKLFVVAQTTSFVGATFSIVGDLVPSPTDPRLREVHTHSSMPFGPPGHFVDIQEDVVVGLDSATVAVTFACADLAAVGASCPPNATSVTNTLVLTKRCDFDSRIAGVFAAQVTLQSASGDCSAADDLSGAKQWAITTANGRSAASVVSLNGGTPEYFSTLSFAAGELRFALDHANEVPGKPLWQAGSAYALDLDVRSLADVRLSGTFTRALAGGCRQTYAVSATRAQGARVGVACPDICGVDTTSCPPIAAALASAPFAYQFSLAEISDPTCARLVCELAVPGRALCDPGSRRLAVSGCPPTLQMSLTESNTASGACLSLGCAPADACAAATLEFGGNGGVADNFGDVCSAADVVSFGGGVCPIPSCRAPNPLCTGRAPPCGDTLGAGELVTGQLDTSACGASFCALNASAQAALIDAPTAAAMAAGPYRIIGFDPPLAAALGTTPRTLLVQSAADPAACPAFNPSSVAPPDTLVLYRRGAADLCAAIYAPQTQAMVAGF